MDTPDADPKPADAPEPSARPATPPEPVTSPAPAVEPAALVKAKPANNDDVRLRRATRRGFATAGVSLLAGYGAWRWLKSRPEEDGLIWPLRRVLEANERLARAAFRPSRLSPEFARGRERTPRVNGVIGMSEADWRLNVQGGPAEGVHRQLSLDDVKALPRFEQTTELRCIEGWSTVVHWAGARLADLAATTGLASRTGAAYDPSRSPRDLYEYVSLTTPDRGYYVGLDTPSALHPQTLLCYEMNGAPLSTDHGAPLRLVIPLKYGIKNIKQVGTIRFTDRRPADYWAEQGYDWYSGH